LLQGCLKILVLDDVLSPDLASAEPAGTDPTADGFRSRATNRAASGTVNM